ncbi:MAG: peptidoglycan-binding protein [Clostridiales bacterium]|nr:peptidoglycan-binding protein [Clostridiales bacterium]
MGVTGEMIASKAKELCTEKKNIFGTVVGYTPQEIPYVAGGETLAGLDCQGLVEWVLRELGIKSNYRGTNHMWRNMLSDKGDIAYGVEKHGEIPIGALIFICDYSTVPNGYTDVPDCEHVYIKIADKFLLHASSSNGKLAIRDFADKAIPNGGPTHYGLIRGIGYAGVEAEETKPAEEPQAEQKRNWRPLYDDMAFKIGGLGNGTREIQYGLNRLDYGLNVDGEFGPLTEAAVKDFQEKYGLEVDGIVGRKTWKALIDAVNAA